MNRFLYAMIEKSLWLGMVIVPMAVSIQSAAARDPLDKGRTNNQPPAVAATKPADNDAKRNAVRQSPPPQRPPETVSKPNREARGGNSGISRTRGSGPPPRIDAPAKAIGPPPVINKAPNDAPRIIRERNPVGQTIAPAVKNNLPPPTIVGPPAKAVDTSPKVVGPAPKIVGPAPLEKQRTNNAGTVRDRKYSPAAIPQPAISANKIPNPVKELQPLAERDERPGLSDIRKRLDEKEKIVETIRRITKRATNLMIPSSINQPIRSSRNRSIKSSTSPPTKTSKKAASAVADNWVAIRKKTM